MEDDNVELAKDYAMKIMESGKPGTHIEAMLVASSFVLSEVEDNQESTKAKVLASFFDFLTTNDMKHDVKVVTEAVVRMVDPGENSDVESVVSMASSIIYSIMTNATPEQRQHIERCVVNGSRVMEKHHS